MNDNRLQQTQSSARRDSIASRHNKSMSELSQRTAFRTGKSNSIYEQKVHDYLGNWFGTTKGLPIEWSKNLDTRLA